MFNFAPDKYTTYLLVWRCGSSDALAPLFYSTGQQKIWQSEGQKLATPLELATLWQPRA